MQTTISTFESILKYELAAAERYRRYVSLVMIHSPLTPCGVVMNIVEPTIRRSDVVASADSYVCVLLGETELNDTLRVAGRYDDTLGLQLEARFSVTTYPPDPPPAETFMKTAQSRLLRAIAEKMGHVVYAD